MTGKELKDMLARRHENEMRLTIYHDPVEDEEDYWVCPDDKPELHDDCQMNVKFGRQQISFLTEQMQHQERLLKRMTDVAVAQEITMRHQKQTILSKAKNDNEEEIE
jgi:hypothetical protein